MENIWMALLVGGGAAAIIAAVMGLMLGGHVHGREVEGESDDLSGSADVVAGIIERDLSEEYQLIEGLVVEDDGETIELGHIIVSPFGVFVVVVEGVAGWLFGGETGDHWTLVFDNKKRSIPNLAKKIKKDVDILTRLLDIKPEALHSAVVLVGGWEFKTRQPGIVMDKNALIEWIASFDDPVILPSEVKRVRDALHSP